MIIVTEQQLRTLAPNAHLEYVRGWSTIAEVLERYEIRANALRVAHFFAQVLHESGGFRIREESLNYTPDALLKIFGAKRISGAVADAIGRKAGRPANEQAIANTIYGGAWGKKNLGNLVDGDGWRYRGRGPMQITGRSNYGRFGDLLGIDLIAQPELALDARYIYAIPAAYWKARGCSAHADADDLRLVTIAINGGTIGLDDRAAWLKRTKTVWP
jgi:putative chitinase